MENQNLWQSILSDRGKRNTMLLEKVYKQLVQVLRCAILLLLDGNHHCQRKVAYMIASEYFHKRRPSFNNEGRFVSNKRYNFVYEMLKIL